MDEMKYVKAEIKDAETVFKMVQDTIISVYPKYYPKEVVDFFCDLHSKERIMNDIIDGNVRLLMIGDDPIGTGSYREDHITRWNCQELCSLKNTQNSLSIIVQFADCNRCNCSSHIFGILSSSP